MAQNHLITSVIRKQQLILNLYKDIFLCNNVQKTRRKRHWTLYPQMLRVQRKV